MSIDMLFELSTKLIGGLGLFLLGMKYMSEGMQAVTGKRLRKMIGVATTNRVAACTVGTVITAIIQSSSVCSVMAIGFVNAGLMNLTQAIGVIIGSNIGTTFTAWILSLEALKIGDYGLLILGISAFVFMFSKSEKTRYTALSLLGIGMVFYGMKVMSSGFKTPEIYDILKGFFATLNGTTYMGLLKCAVVGCVATMIVQSSSATTGVTMALATANLINYNTAAGLVLGLNIGTTITAVLASINSCTDGKRAAYAHVIFNVVGTLWLFPFFFKYTAGIEHLLGADAYIGTKIALTHTGFNVINTIVILPFMGYLVKAVTYLVPEKKKIEHHLTYLDIRAINAPALGIVQSRDQVFFMADSVQGMMDRLKNVTQNTEKDTAQENKIFQREDVLDNVQKEIFVFLSKLVAGEVSQEVSIDAHNQMRLADEYESLSDYIAHVLKGHIKLRENELAISDVGQKELLDLHTKVASYIRKINIAVKENDKNILPWASAEGAKITSLMKQYREKHLERVVSGEVDALQSLVFTDLLNQYRRMRDHAKNIAEVVAGEK